MRNNYDIIYI